MREVSPSALLRLDAFIGEHGDKSRIAHFLGCGVRSAKHRLHFKCAGSVPHSMWHAGRSVYVESATKAFKRARTLPAAAVRTTFASCTEVTGARTSLLDPDIAP
jgi:hypothetical protein